VHGLSSARHRRASSSRAWFSASSGGSGVGSRQSPVSGKLALKLGLCLCAGQLIAGPVLASAAEAAPVAVTAKAVAPAKAKVTETTNTRTINYGATVRVTAKVINPKTGKVVTKGRVRLQAWRNHAWRTWQLRNLSKAGTVSFTSKPLITGTYRAVYLGSTQASGAASNGIKVTVRQKAGAKVLAEAKRHTGALYKYAAAGPSRFDCSGFTMYVYRKAIGKKLPHKANSQQKYGKAVSKSKKQVGDLIIFRSGSYGYHAGIYAGGGYMYDSPHSGARVGKHKIFSSSYVVRRLAA
jgi:cell wall-associated NlpC family hydrolase